MKETRGKIKNDIKREKQENEVKEEEKRGRGGTRHKTRETGDAREGGRKAGRRE